MTTLIVNGSVDMKEAQVTSYLSKSKPLGRGLNLPINEGTPKMKHTYYYFLKVLRGYNARGQGLWEHCYLDTLEEALALQSEERAKGNEATGIIMTDGKGHAEEVNE